MENKAIRCKSLQVGDWIQNELGFQMRVTSVGEDYAQATYEGYAYPWEFDDATNKPYGIPLTSDILEHNGWLNDNELDNWWHDMVEFVIFYDLKSLRDFYAGYMTQTSLGTVDKLQRLLRCCGHEGLADDFKI